MSETTIYVRHRVPGASMDLTIPVHLTINVPDDLIARNVRENSRRPGSSKFGRIPRIKTAAAHDRVAVLCGSGPSLADHLSDVRGLHGDLFALNGAANFLASNGIVPDYQVLVDARDRTADLIGVAKAHLFASQCDPVCFERKPTALMWHFINGDLDSMLPADEEAHAQIGGAGSVGNCALALAWAMGYRRFEIFGYDSSHRGDNSHAFHQALNDFEPWGRFEFNGKGYIASYTMRSQASRFQLVANALLLNGCVVNVHGDGLLPDMWRESQRIRAGGTLAERERLKYELAWTIPDYHMMSPAAEHRETINRLLGYPTKGLLIDFGCGTGRATRAFQDQGLDVLGVDFVKAALEVNIPFLQAVLWEPLPPLAGDYGICCDVMEHIPPDKVVDVLGNIRASVAGPVFFSISLVPDSFGAEVGQVLHETVMPHDWWAEHLAQHWHRVESVGDGIFLVNPK